MLASSATPLTWMPITIQFKDKNEDLHAGDESPNSIHLVGNARTGMSDDHVDIVHSTDGEDNILLVDLAMNIESADYEHDPEGEGVEATQSAPVKVVWKLPVSLQLLLMMSENHLCMF
ncbi:hypothetical protein H0H87_011197 [Tephrocybe sp. NHM501043]|nr:hypothetical protein H0H87_011197 [Tephrocybe sp. NHM501043]